jgi:hypothetical protein
MDYWFIAYLLICFAIAGTFLRMFASSGQTTASILSLLLLIAIFVFYGLRWFKNSELKGASAAGGVAWPPIVNACPDFMVTYTSTAPGTSGNIYCYDAGNIYNFQNSNPDTVINSVVVNGAGTDAQKVLLAKNSTSSPLYTAFKDNTYQNLVGKTMLTWEGVWDGIKKTTK